MEDSEHHQQLLANAYIELAEKITGRVLKNIADFLKYFLNILQQT